MTNIIHRLKCRFSEPYRIRMGFGLSPIRNKREEKALIAFCREQLKDKNHTALNPKRKRIFTVTVKYYETNGYIDLSYIEVYCDWYWS